MKIVILMLFLISSMARSSAAESEANGPNVPFYPGGYQSASDCREKTKNLSTMADMTADCRWTSGGNEVSPPNADSRVCAIGSDQKMVRQKLCSGEVTCSMSPGTITFPGVICGADQGDCADSQSCLKKFAALTSSSCKDSSDLPVAPTQDVPFNSDSDNPVTAPPASHKKKINRTGVP